VPAELREAVAGKQVVWVHAVSVGEVLAATRLVAELEARLTAEFGGDWIIAVSTTTATGQALARERFGAGAGVAGRVFWYPLDFAWAVRAYLNALQPKLLVLMESELWPRMLVECERRGVPVAVVNARVSDRSYRRGLKVRAVWGKVLRRVDLFLAQSEEDGRRLMAMGAGEPAVRGVGNLKYDVSTARGNSMSSRIGSLLWQARLVVCGSTLRGEEAALLTSWPQIQKKCPNAVLLVAPRHPDRFQEVADLVRAMKWPFFQCTNLMVATEPIFGGTILILDTVGDLAAVYGLADVAFVGGSLVARGGHNPLEPAQFGVPVVMGPSFENFREIVERMRAVGGIHIIGGVAGLSATAAKSAASGRDDSSLPKDELAATLVELLTDREKAQVMGERGRRVFEEQQGATARAIEALVGLVKG
jgi:3-deoxy-D-manno-octulosonic-acid transferase